MGNGQVLEMNMKLTDSISLSVVKEAQRLSETQCEIILEEKNTDIIVSGKKLEAAVRVTDTRFLLFTTDDIVYEESLNIFYIDTQSGVIESLFLGGEYVTGTFENLSVNKNSASFSFIGDTTWTVQVLPTPSLRLPFSDPRGVSRPMRLRKYIDISADPAPARAEGSR